MEKSIAGYSRGTGFATCVSLIPSASTIPNPAWRWKSIWQWRNQGPGLSVWIVQWVQCYGGEILRNTYNETNGDLVTGAADADDISKNSVIEIVTSLAGTSNNPEVMLQRTAWWVRNEVRLRIMGTYTMQMEGMRTTNDASRDSEFDNLA